MLLHGEAENQKSQKTYILKVLPSSQDPVTDLVFVPVHCKLHQGVM